MRVLIDANVLISAALLTMELAPIPTDEDIAELQIRDVKDRPILRAAMKAGQEFSELQDSYMVFITQTDIFGHGIPIYTINRHFEEIDESFDDGSHIVYVNGNYKGDDTFGRLMHDFGCKEAKDMYYPELAKG